jgi:uncharacterized Zn finger protein
MREILNKCRCGIAEKLVIHESGGHVLIICENCGKRISIKGTREKAIRRWNGVK